MYLEYLEQTQTYMYVSSDADAKKETQDRWLRYLPELELTKTFITLLLYIQ